MRIGVKYKFINHVFYDAIISSGSKNISDFAIKCGVSSSSIGRYLNLKDYPRDLKVVRRLEKALNLPFEYLFDDEVRRVCEKKMVKSHYYLSKEVHVVSLESTPIKELPLVNQEFDKEALANDLNDILLSLTEREENVIKMRFGLEDGKERTFKYIGERINVCAQRATQIFSKGMRKLRNPVRSRKVKQYLEV